MFPLGQFFYMIWTKNLFDNVRICSVFEDAVAKDLLLHSKQDVFNLLPNLNVHELVKSFAGEF